MSWWGWTLLCWLNSAGSCARTMTCAGATGYDPRAVEGSESMTYEDCRRAVREELLRNLPVMEAGAVEVGRIHDRIEEVWELGLVGSLLFSHDVGRVLPVLVPSIAVLEVSLDGAEGQDVDLMIAFKTEHEGHWFYFKFPVRLVLAQRGTRCLDPGKILD